MFEISAESGSARTGILKTAHGKIKTPFFMPVATKGAVKYIDIPDLKNIGTDCIISNALLQYQRPGLKTIQKAGGLHKFYNWDKGIFTDSGGFQTLDEFFKKKSTHDGAYFQSPYDNMTELITPEKAMNIQLTLGSDVAMCLDDVPKHDDDLQTTRTKTLRTHSWAKRCKRYHDRHRKKQLLFGIAQGGMYKDIRKKSIDYISGLGFDGIALGGLAIGEPIPKMFEMLKASVPHMPKAKPRYLMGVGSPDDLVKCIKMGVDMFDSKFPAENARHGTLFTSRGNLKIGQRRYADDQRPIEKDCGCITCQNHTRSYVRHLLNVNHPVGKRLATYHNLYHVQQMIEDIREDISRGRF
jgi:queuine tRNA-ribosyltransferase